MNRALAFVGPCIVLLAACSASPDVPALAASSGGGGSGGGSGGRASAAGAGGLNIGGASSSRLHAVVRQGGALVEILTLSCGECVELEAFATGGNEPYVYEWDDGSRLPLRRVCPAETTQYSVSATDAGGRSVEIQREPETVQATLTVSVLPCPSPEGGTAEPADSGPSPSCEPLRVLSAVPSGFAINAPPFPDYSADFGVPPLVISQARLPLARPAECAHLFLAGDAAGTQPVGWDNYLIVEARAPGGGVLDRWFYGAGEVRHAGAPLPLGLPPTVSGFVLGIPNPLPFGYEPRAVDLASRLAGAEASELFLTVVDGGAFGSNTDVWIIRR